MVASAIALTTSPITAAAAGVEHVGRDLGAQGVAPRCWARTKIREPKR